MPEMAGNGRGLALRSEKVKGNGRGGRGEGRSAQRTSHSNARSYLLFAHVITACTTSSNWRCVVAR